MAVKPYVSTLSAVFAVVAVFVVCIYAKKTASKGPFMHKKDQQCRREHCRSGCLLLYCKRLLFKDKLPATLAAAIRQPDNDAVILEQLRSQIPDPL